MDRDTLMQKLAAGYVRRAPHMADAGMTVAAVAPGVGRMTMPARSDWVGDPGRRVLHPGVLTVLADSACGLAVGTALSEPVPYATLDLRMDYLRPAGPDADLHGEARCFRLTRSVAFVRADVWQADPAQPLATAQATFMLGTPAGTPRGAKGPVGTAGADEAAALAATPAVSPGWQPGQPRRELALAPPIPYVQYLGVGVSDDAQGQPLYRMPYQPRLIGNPWLPALHGGVVAGFAETAAMLHLSALHQGTKLPKGIDFAIDYLRPGRPEETFASCELVRVGGRVALVIVRCWQGAGPDKPIGVARGHFLLAAVEG